MTRDEFRRAINLYAATLSKFERLPEDTSDEACGKLSMELIKLHNSLMECYDQLTKEVKV